MAGRDLVLSELALLGAVLARRDPDLVSVVERLGVRPVTDAERERLRRAIVDELCEIPNGSGDRRALELQDLLVRLGRV